MSTQPEGRRPRKAPVNAPAAPQQESAEEMEARLRAEIEARVRAEIAATTPVDEADALIPEYTPAPQDADDVVIIHFVEDGLTALGKTWYRGEEMRIVPGSEEWNLLLDKNGNTWLFLDEDQQIARWGHRYFRDGPWRGQSFDLDDPLLNDEERATLARIAAGQQTTYKPRSDGGSKPSFLAGR